jgi:hypothetical protein
LKIHVVLTLLHVQAFLHITVPALALTAFTRVSLLIALQVMSNPMKQEDTNSLFQQKVPLLYWSTLLL